MAKIPREMIEKLAPKNPKELLDDHWVNLELPGFRAYLLTTALKGVNNHDMECERFYAHGTVCLDERLWFH